MNRLELERYFVRYPELKELDVMYLTELKDETNQLYPPISALEQQLQFKPYHIVVIDSIAELIEYESLLTDESRKSIEKKILELLNHQNQANFTSFILIQQVTKMNQFLGSNRFKHLVHGMLELHYADGENSNDRYMVFSKNRSGNTLQKLYYRFDDKGRLFFDQKRLIEEQKVKSFINRDKNNLAQENSNFENWIKSIDQNKDE